MLTFALTHASAWSPRPPCVAQYQSIDSSKPNTAGAGRIKRGTTQSLSGPPLNSPSPPLLPINQLRLHCAATRNDHSAILSVHTVPLRGGSREGSSSRVQLIASFTHAPRNASLNQPAPSRPQQPGSPRWRTVQPPADQIWWKRWAGLPNMAVHLSAVRKG